MALFILLTLGRLDQSSGYDDLSIYKFTAHNPSYRSCTPTFCELLLSRNAVDRQYETCSRTDIIGPISRNTSAWWYVDLGDIYSVYEVQIIFKSYGLLYEMRQRGRFAGFSLFLCNSTEIEDGLLCYKDGPDIPPLHINVTCVGHARYLFFYNERLRKVDYPDGYERSTYTELCEVIVLGCAEGTYGSNCDLQCPENCQEKVCDIVNGTCFGCKPGWTEKFCDQECTAGSYGQNCKYQCAGHCLNGLPCNHVTGECPDKCAAGWTGTYCENPCGMGKYGSSCTFNCSSHCKDNIACNIETGHCDTGCNAGYKGVFCNEACTFGRFGNGCVNICSGHCLYNETCSHVNGICSKGCAPGYFGSLCNKVCPNGSFGLNCSGTCSRNCIGTCGLVDGSCKCVPGFTDSPNCTTECIPGFYGVNCQYRCSGQCVNEETCSRYDGSCSLGCKDNYVGIACDFLQDNSTNASTVGLAIVVSVLFLCLIAAVIFSYLRSHNCINLKRRKPRSAAKDLKNLQSSFTKTNNPDDGTQNYQDLNTTDDKNSYELLQSSKSECAYQNLDLTI